MKRSDEHLLLAVNDKLSASSEEEVGMPILYGRLPSVDELKRVASLVKAVLFPGFFGERQLDYADLRKNFTAVKLDELYSVLRVQIKRGLRQLPDNQRPSDTDLVQRADALAGEFIAFLPELKRLLLTDIDAMYHSDPAVRSRGEVIFCYPVTTAMIHFRMAHKLHKLGIPLIPRILTELAHSATGIDIHPGAEIGEYFAIDHGTGVVIGETCIIGKHVTIYQGVTLGAKNFDYDENGIPLNTPRHPVIEDNVTIYSNASVLGRITIGHDAVIGGNVWVTHDVAPHTKIVQEQ